MAFVLVPLKTAIKDAISSVTLKLSRQSAWEDDEPPRNCKTCCTIPHILLWVLEDRWWKQGGGRNIQN